VTLKIVDPKDGRTVSSPVVVPQELPEGMVLSSVETHYHCNWEKLGAGKLLVEGEATAEVKSTSDRDIYLVYIVSPNIDNYNKLRKLTLLAVGYTEGLDAVAQVTE
jgi:hypothetical protein